ncbi:cation:proton antiporter [Thiomicrorhabdus sp. 6S3-12]|uniref:cation:proton antiporter domain-containing protein n=1 Tax=Thiomicrorhabdus sp. 6S3-12 TaxID=2819681 RepID=UPI001AAD28F0|nr:cation:proton antiporter [Thiomicrorhabdus sp. 6S3-12]MBO1923273.1 cation:proton antiporter [Thiomicrorhabdus sp. 6S3-12]
MLLLFTLILSVVLLARFFEERFRVPFALSSIFLAYLANFVFDLQAFGDFFPEIVYLMLPIILIPDVLGVSRSELKNNLAAITYLSLIAVILSIALAIGITYLVLPEYHFAIGVLLALFAPLMATDVVSVTSIFGHFKLPVKLKLYAEGESLFNDITAMMIFFFVALPLISGHDFAFSQFTLNFGKMLFESVLIGLAVGLMGYYAFKFFSDSVEQFLSLYIMASMAFLVSEHQGVSGIMGVVVTILLFKYLFDKEGHYKKLDASALYGFLNSESASEVNFRAYRKEAHYLGFFANGVIFVAIASVVDLQLLWKYHLEILLVFVLTTLIRFLMISPLIWWKKHPFRWSGALTLAGMKGGLAVIMVFALPEDFIYREAFMAIVLGVVMLSMFVYTGLLVPYLKYYAAGFALDKADDRHHYSDQEAKEQLKKILQKDSKTQAYNALVFEELIEKEMARSQRHLEPFALLAFETEDVKLIKRKVLPFLRKSDYFGKLGPQRYAILATYSDIDAATIFAHKLKDRLGDLHIAVAEYATGDTLEMLYDKLESAFNSRKPIDIEI